MNMTLDMDVDTTPKPPVEGWVRYGSARTKALVWIHSTGCYVQHCGHPTALYPYYAFLPSGHSPSITFPAGFANKHKGKYAQEHRAAPKFAALGECQAWILKYYAGWCTLSDAAVPAELAKIYQLPGTLAPMEDGPACPSCGGQGHKHSVSSTGAQRYRCAACKRTWSSSTGRAAGRPLLGEAKLTNAEKQRRYRERKAK